ncbi:MAG: hypothetical protein PHF86_15205 [Candidatus Nanoarchaeia archaeon]|nr:hypothetical protein [Candidatus Nanoarchaeia archaeon]
MKIRKGFVSNSSTSSFLIYGTAIDSEDRDVILINEIKKLKTIEEFKSVYKYTDEEIYNIIHQENQTVDQIIENFTEEYEGEWEDLKCDSDLFLGTSDVGYCIGKSPSSAPNDITFGDWKKQIEEETSELLGKKVKCGWIDKAWRDG